MRAVDDKDKGTIAASQAKRRQTLLRQRATRRYRSYPPKGTGETAKLLDQELTLDILGNQGAEELAQWLTANGFEGIHPTAPPGPDTVMAAALRYAMTRYPEASDLDVCSFATLAQRLTTGVRWGFATEDYANERQAELIVLAIAGAMPAPVDGITVRAPNSTSGGLSGPDFTGHVLAFLEAFYFGDVADAVSGFVDLSEGTVAETVLAMAQTAADHVAIVKLVERGEILTTVQVATEYDLASRNVVAACKQGRLGEGAVNLTATWLITRAAAHREWGYRLTRRRIPPRAK